MHLTYRDHLAHTGVVSAEPAEAGAPKIEVTPAMIDAGADVILCEVGGADLGGFFSAPDLAVRVFRAMRTA